ncbi:glycosyltransferase [Rubrivirga litoralis]|uniref:Glycosyltransferase n=1 Tax=Rubrivirga litoralis TaxID=3075598 RepID=A0ABU3BSL3_9BACT|nr:glycosyltransferase [Rubrivirga sp. F394]MDT0632267.1 glycosyltransferase [Rubrivirga sp. F394]
MSLSVWLAVLVAAFVVQALGWAWAGAGLRRVQEGGVEPDAPLPHPAPFPVSVVVAAHDEAARLPALLDALARQRYDGADGRPAFEVVVVDDRSTDATADVVARRAQVWERQGGPALRLVAVAPGEPEAAGLPPKKHALAQGVEAARHDRLALTDADGRPPPTWLAALALWAGGADGAPDDGAVLVGYGPMEPGAGWTNRFARYETVQTATLAAAGAGWGRPWHAVGRNLSYPRGLPARVGGFSAASLSGDDDLLVQAVARADAAPVDYVLDARAAVPSPAPPSPRAFWRQKRRHAGAGAHYPAGVLAALGLFHTANLALWLGAPLLHVLGGAPYGWGLLAAKLLVQRTALLPAFDAFEAAGDLRLWQPVLDGLSAGYHAVLAVLGALPGPTRW